MTGARRPGQQIAAAWFLGAIFVVFLVFAWLRGMGRLLIPLLLLGLAGYGIARLVSKLREPVD